MTATKPDTKPVQPSAEVMSHWPDISGNRINGLGEAVAGPPRPVFWRTDGSTPHGPVMFHFFEKSMANPALAEARKYRDRQAAIPDHDQAPAKATHTAEDWSRMIKEAAIASGADDAGICRWRAEWAFPDRPAPKGEWAVVMAFAHDYDTLNTAPDEAAYIEVMAQYERAGAAAKHLANWIHDQGYPAEAKTGPMTEDVLMIPPAIEAGLGELGKHGSMIHRRFGANFRLSMVLTDMPLLADEPDIFGADQFCQNCQVCANACPPDAIFREKQMVRGQRKWYVDFDKCLPYFVDNKTCGICLAVCPWSRPGIADNLVAKMARRMARLGGGPLRGDKN